MKMKAATVLALAAVAGVAAYVLLGPRCEAFRSGPPKTSWGHHTRPYGLRPDFAMV